MEVPARFARGAIGVMVRREGDMALAFRRCVWVTEMRFEGRVSRSVHPRLPSGPALLEACGGAAAEGPLLCAHPLLRSWAHASRLARGHERSERSKRATSLAVGGGQIGLRLRVASCATHDLGTIGIASSGLANLCLHICKIFKKQSLRLHICRCKVLGIFIAIALRAL